MLRRTSQVCGNLRVKTELLIKPLDHIYFSQAQFSCSKSTIETLEQGFKMFKFNNKDTKMMSMT